MNREPDTSGIEKRWKGDDARIRLAELLYINADSGAGRQRVDSFIRALQEIVLSRRRTKIVGFGVFEWRPWKNRIPTGRKVETWRLVFKPSRYERSRKWK